MWFPLSEQVPFGFYFSCVYDNEYYNITTRLLSPPRSYQTPRRGRGVMITSMVITTVWHFFEINHCCDHVCFSDYKFIKLFPSLDYEFIISFIATVYLKRVIKDRVL